MGQFQVILGCNVTTFVVDFSSIKQMGPVHIEEHETCNTSLSIYRHRCQHSV